MDDIRCNFSYFVHIRVFIKKKLVDVVRSERPNFVHYRMFFFKGTRDLKLSILIIWENFPTMYNNIEVSFCDTVPLKQHLFKKLSNSNFNYANKFYSWLKNFPSPRIFGWPSTGSGESFWKSNNSVKKQKNRNGPRTSPMGQGGAVWGKKYLPIRRYSFILT